MANYAGAIDKFNPYVQQIPTEAYTSVGMLKEQQYNMGVAKIQETVDNVYGLDVARGADRAYVQARGAELTSKLNKYSSVDFSNPNNVGQLQSLAKPIFSDNNIINAVSGTAIYRNWNKQANDAYKAGKMELGQYTRETMKANEWVNGQVAGESYSGPQTANTATKKDLTDRIVKAKKDAFEKNEFVYDRSYSPDRPYYIKTTDKYYNEADFNNYITENLITDKDREMLMNEHWLQNRSKSTEQLRAEDMLMYQSKIDENVREIDRIKNMPGALAGDQKTEYENRIASLTNYNNQLKTGKMDFLAKLDPNDPTTRDVFHRDIAENRYMQGLAILQDKVHKEEYVKNEQWFLEKEYELKAADDAMKAAAKAKADGDDKVKNPIEEVAFFSPTQPGDPGTPVTSNVIRTPWDQANARITSSMNGLISKLQASGINTDEYFNSWEQVNDPNKAGAITSVPKFHNQQAKDKFYNLVSGLNFIYEKENDDGHLDNADFTKYVKTYIPGYKDEDPNAKFNLGDKAVNDALNQMKGTTALLPRLEKLFADKQMPGIMAEIDNSIKAKKESANNYRNLLLSAPGALTTEERRAILNISDDDLMSRRDVTADDVKKYRAEGVNGPAISSSKSKTPSDKITVTFGDGSVETDEQIIAKLRAEGKGSGINKISKKALDFADTYIKNNYSYVQQNLNTSMENLKQDKASYSALQSAMAGFIQLAKNSTSKDDLKIDGLDDPTSISGVSDVEVTTATIANSQDIFNPNPKMLISFKTTEPDPDDKSKFKVIPRTAEVSMKSFLATNPNYRTSKYARYFATALYGEEGAQVRLKATVNPLEGSDQSYVTRNNVDPVFNRVNAQTGNAEFAYDEVKYDSKGRPTNHGNEYQWGTHVVSNGGKQTAISYQVVSAGQSADRANTKGGQFENGAYYLKLKVPASGGGPKTVTLKNRDGAPIKFNSPEEALWMLKDQIFTPSMPFEDVDQSTGLPDYFSANESTIRGILNAQLSYNGYSKLEPVKLKDKLNKEYEKLRANVNVTY